MPVFRLLAAGALAVLLTACQTAPGDAGPASVTRAERLLRQGNHAEAARMYEQLAANNTPPDRDEFALTATRAWLDANRADDAQRTLALAGTALPAGMQFERDLLQVEVAAARGQYQAAWQQVSQTPEPTRPQDASRLFYLRQQVALRAGQPNEAVQAGIARERVAGDDNARTRARRDLLVDLRGAVERGTRIEPARSRDALERGWLELAQIAADVGRSPMSANVWIDRWRQRYPGHPASTIVGVEILDPASRPGVVTDRGTSISGPVALLLPLSDPAYGTFAGLVRDGFRSYVSRGTDAGLADVREYDTTAMSVESAIQRALAEGASFIVGPLLRDEVQVAAEHRPVHVPMLLLNTLPEGGGGPGAWQYALSPEDEARQIARQIAGSGARGVVVLAPAGDWGQRVAAAFSAELNQAGARVVHEGIYDLNSANIEATITRALGIDAGRMRRERIQNVIGSRVTFNGYEQPAPGIDAIFAAGNQSLALRQIRPYLRQYNANEIPTYMTSDGIGEERTANRDLSGMRVLEMPWHLDTVGAAYDVRQATESSWLSRGGQRNSRFFAFGYDAAMLASALRRGLPDWPLQGVTGRLSLTPEGRIERQLNWARVRDGLVEPSDPLSP